jgi:hypothetical protein
MRRVTFLLLLAVGPLGSQTTATRAGIAPAPIAATRIPEGMLASLEKGIDGRLVALDPMDPIDMLGGTRGLYLPGYGTVFTIELSLIVTPGNFPIATLRYTPEFKAVVRQRKLARLPKLEEAMKEMVKMTALTLLPMPDDQRIVLAVRLRYLPEEDTTGLPAQIVMSADKKSARLGDVKTEIE